MNYLFSLHPTHSVSTIFACLPAKMTPWINLFQVPAVFVSSCWAAADGFEAVSPWQLRKSPAALEDSIALRVCHVIEVFRHSEPGSCQGHPSHLVGSCPIVSLLCFASVQLKEMWNPQPQSLWVYRVWMSSLSACFKAVPFRKHQDFVFEWCKSAAWQWKHQVLLRFESVVAENTSYADWRWQLSLLRVLKFVSLSIFSLIRTTVLTSSITLSSVPLGTTQRTCLGDLFWDYKDS